MMELNSVSIGQVRSIAQIRDERIRQGFCGDECHVSSNPTKCYEIKKRFGGLKRKRIPLTVPGEVLRGVCLKCHPEMDPDPNTDGIRRKANSDRVLSVGGLPTSSNISQAREHHNSAPPILQQPPSNLSSRDVEIVEEVTCNVFGQTILVERPKVVPRAAMPWGVAEEQRGMLQEEEQALGMKNSFDVEVLSNTDSNNSSMHVQPSSSHNDSDDNRDLTSRLAKEIETGEGGLDAIARAIAAACQKNPELREAIANRCFIPGDFFVPNAELSFEEWIDNSELTDSTIISVDTRNMGMEAALQHPQPMKEAARMYSRNLAETQSTTSFLMSFWFFLLQEQPIFYPPLPLLAASN